jgi:hypothetical protein
MTASKTVSKYVGKASNKTGSKATLGYTPKGAARYSKKSGNKSQSAFKGATKTAAKPVSKMRMELADFVMKVRIINLCLATALHEEQVAYAHWRADRPSRASWVMKNKQQQEGCPLNFLRFALGVNKAVVQLAKEQAVLNTQLVVGWALGSARTLKRVMQAASRKRNRVNRSRGAKIARKSDAQRKADRTVRSARADGKAARRQWRKPLTRTAARLRLVENNPATARPAYWYDWQTPVFGRRQAYGSTASHEPDNYYTTIRENMETTGLYNPLSAAAPVIAEPTEQGEVETTALYNPGAVAVTAAPVVEETTALYNPGFSSPSAVSVAPSVPTGLAVPAQLLPLTIGETPMTKEAFNLEAYKEAGKAGLAGMLAKFSVLRKTEQALHLANPIALAMVNVRGAGDQALALPSAIQEILSSGERAIIPEGQRELIPGAHNLNLLIANQPVQGQNVIFGQAGSKTDKGATKTGIKFCPVGINPEYNTIKAIEYTSVFAALSKSPASTGERPTGKVYQTREVKFFTPLVVEALLLHKVGITVVLTEQVLEAVEVFLKSPAAKTLEIKAKYVGVPANWLMPVANVSYETAADAFRCIQGTILALYPGNPGVVPLFFVEDEDGFTLILGGGTRINVKKGIGGRPAQVYHLAAGSTARYTFRSLVATVPGLQGVIPTDHCVKLDPLAVLWYFFEVYGFAGMNRPHRGLKQQGVQAGEGTYLSRFICNELPVQYLENEIAVDTMTQRTAYEQGKFDLCIIAMPLPFLILRGNPVLGEPGLKITPASVNDQWTIDREGNKANMTTAFYKMLQETGSLTSNKAPSLAMTNALNEMGLVLNPTGDVSEAVSADLVSIQFHSATKMRFRQMLSLLWAEFEPTLGAYDKTNDMQLVEAIWSKPEIRAELEKVGMSQHDAISTRAQEFWNILQREFRVLLSGKQSKVIKRVAMTYSVACRTENEVDSGVRMSDDEITMVQLVKAWLAPGLKSTPGTGLMQWDRIRAYYATNRQIGSLIQPIGESAWVQLEPDFALVAGRLTTFVEDEEVFAGYVFGDKVKVKQGSKLGTLYTTNAAGFDQAQCEIYADANGHLNRIGTHFKTAVGGEITFYVHAKVTELVTNSLKLRSMVALKLNALSVDVRAYVAPSSQPNLNPAQAENLEMVVYGDSYKGSDNLTALVKLAGVNIVAYKDVVPGLRDLLIKTNYATQKFLGQTPWENDKFFRVEPEAIATGIYVEAVATFQAMFETSLWHFERTPVADMFVMRNAHTRNRAVAALAAAAIPSSRLQGDVWRFVGAAEARTIKGANGVGLSAELIDEIAQLELAGTYKSADLPVGNAYIVTNAVGVIKDTDHVSCGWSEMIAVLDPTDKNLKREIDVPHYCMLDRSYGWAGKEGIDMLYPVEVESIPVPQSVSSTSAMPFSLVQFAVEGKSDLALSHLIKVRENTHFDGLIHSMLWGRHLNTGAGNSLYNLGGYEHDLAVEVLPQDLLAKLQTAEIYKDDTAFLGLLAQEAGDIVFRIPKSIDADDAMTVHLGTLYAWNKGSLRQGGDSALKAIAAWFKAWIVGGNRPHSDLCLRIIGSAHRMLTAYYNGKGHMKGLLRGNESVYMKAQASALVPSNELWINATDAHHFCKVFDVDSIDQITTVGFRRMPMFATNISKIRFLQKSDINYYRKQYGVYFCAGLAYMGAAQMYSNFGDLDGDAIEIGNMSREFAAGMCSPHNFNTIRTMLASVLGVDSLDYTYWLDPHADQYIADHFMIESWSKFQNKCKVSWKANCTTRARFAELQLAAGAVQTVTVGLTYRVATLTLMMAEILPVIWDRVVALNQGVAPEWLSAFEWTRQADCATTIARLIQLYEVALGGYDLDMSKVTLGYLVRAMNAQTEVGADTPADLATAINLRGTSSSMSHLLPTLPNYREAKHLNLTEVTGAFEALGFQAADLGIFLTCFQMCGLCTEASRKEKEMAKLPHELQLIFSMVQVVLDISQVKLDGEKSVISYKSYDACLANAVVIEAQGNEFYSSGLAELNQTIRYKTVSGALFDAFVTNNNLVEASKATTIDIVRGNPVPCFSAGALAQVTVG